MNSNKTHPDWTLFLDRDGIINRKIEDGYVLSWKDFEFIPSFLKSIKSLSETFGRIIIVTNQRCIARKMLTRSGLKAIHANMLGKLASLGVNIDAIYFCPHNTTDRCKCRKPSIGMFESALKDFKDIDPSKCIMVGDSASDMDFGKAAGMITVLVTAKKNRTESIKSDYSAKNLTRIPFHDIIQRAQS